jgi:hypothetical protein
MFLVGKKKLTESIDRLSVEVQRLERAVTTLSNVMGRFVFPQEAMGELSGCLRALIYILDTNKEFQHVLTKAKAGSSRKLEAGVPPIEEPKEKSS